MYGEGNENEYLSFSLAISSSHHKLGLSNGSRRASFHAKPHARILHHPYFRCAHSLSIFVIGPVGMFPPVLQYHVNLPFIGRPYSSL